MSVKICEKTIEVVEDVRDLNVAEIFGIMALDGVDDPTLRDVVSVLGNYYVLSCDPVTKSVVITNDTTYRVSFIPAKEDGIEVKYESLSFEVYFLDTSGCQCGLLRTNWSIDALFDLGVIG